MTKPDVSAPTVTLVRVAQIAEILSSLAVIVTLLFLVAEVRQNTRVTQAAAYEQRIEELNRWRAILVTDSEVAAAWLTDREEAGASQGKVADFRLGILFFMQWAIYENAYYANQRGLLGAAEWSRFERQICVRYENSGSRWDAGTAVTSSERQLLTEEFARFVEDSCK